MSNAYTCQSTVNVKGKRLGKLNKIAQNVRENRAESTTLKIEDLDFLLEEIKELEYMKARPIFCSFCGTHHDFVEKVVAAPIRNSDCVYICNNCAENIVEVIRESEVNE